MALSKTAREMVRHGAVIGPRRRRNEMAVEPARSEGREMITSQYELIEKTKLEALVQRTRDGGAEIVKYLKTGSAYYAPSAAATEMVEAILKDKKKILPCAAFLQGEYGITGLYVGVPVKLGAKGIEQIIEIQLTAEEKAGLDKSAAAVKELCGVIGV